MKACGKMMLVLWLLLLCGEVVAQNTHGQANSYQVWEFVVRNTMPMKIVAARFRVKEKDIRKLSKYRKKDAYPGTVLRIPVAVRPPAWNPEAFNPNQALLGEEDSRPPVEYEWNTDALDPTLKEDFIILHEVKGDSLQLQKINLHISKIDNYILVATARLDSIKKSEFSFDYDEKNMNSVLKRMDQARQRYYQQSPIGKEVDSLSSIKVKLGAESNRIQNRLNEYDYLHENVYYFQKTKGGDRVSSAVTNWNEQVLAEVKYLESKTIKEALAMKKVEAPSPKPVAQTTKPETVAPKTAATTTNSVAPKPNVEASVTKPAVAKTEQNIASDTAHSTQQTTQNTSNETISDIKNAPSEQELSAEQNELSEADLQALKELDAEIYSDTASATQEEGESGEVYEEEADVQPNEKEDALAEEVVETDEKNQTTSAENSELPKENEEEPSAEKNESITSPTELTAEKNTITNTGSQKILGIQNTVLSPQVQKIKTEVERQIPEEDPLDKYENLDRIISGISISPLPVDMVKNQPRYTIIPDSNTIAKAEIYLKRFKDEMKKDNVNEAEKQLRKAIDINPSNSTAWCYHAELQAITGNATNASREYFIAQTIDPKNPRPFYKMGLLYGFANSEGKAYEYYSKAIEADKTYAKAYIARAQMSLKQSDLQAALNDYDLLLEANIGYLEGYKTRALLKMQLRKFKSAVEDFDTYLDIADPEGETLYRRGLAKVYSGNIVDGCVDFRVAQELRYANAIQAIKKYCE